MAHIFFSYAHDDALLLNPIHAQMQNMLERNLWLDRIGLERGMDWEKAIKRAIEDSYCVIFAVTKAFVTRPFILNNEIPWAVDKFKNKQGAQLFPILFDDVPLPNALLTPFITYMLDARDGDIDRVIAELKQVLPTPQAGVHPFVVDWPRSTNFKGRDTHLIELHNKLMGDGRIGVKIVGLHGTGGIGKTQLAVEYAYRYRYHYPGGVYWLNAGADWKKEVAACAVNLDRSLIEKSDEEKALVFRDYLAAQGKDALLVLDNVDDPVEVAKREIAPKLTISDLCGQTRSRLLLTTRMQRLPIGFEAVSVDVLKLGDARSVLLDAWLSGTRKETADTKSLDEIAKTLGYLPLGLILATAALTKRPNLTPSKLLEHLRAMGIDQIADKVGLEKEGPVGYVSRVDVALEWQIGQLERDNARTLLVLLAAYGEAAVIPKERLRLLAGIEDDDFDTPFADGVIELLDYHLVESLSEKTAFRLHPLTRQYAIRHFNPIEQLNESALYLEIAYRDPDTLDIQTRTRGFASVIEDLTSTERLLHTPNTTLNSLTRLLTLEEPNLLTLPIGAQTEYVIQQISERAYHESDNSLRDACDRWLSEKFHLRHSGLRYVTSKALLRTLSAHSDIIQDVVQLADGHMLSLSSDKTLRLWSQAGEPLATLNGHTDTVNSAFQLADRRILSCGHDKTLRLWSQNGSPLATLSGHTGTVYQAIQLADGYILSWSSDKTLRLWSQAGEPRAVLNGHTDSVYGAIQLTDGRILSWSRDETLRLWLQTGEALATLNGHTNWISGALQLTNGYILSWAHDRIPHIWSHDGLHLATLNGHTSTIEGALQLTDGHILSWAGDDTLRLWLETGEYLTTLNGHTSTVKGALQLTDRRILSWSIDKTLRIWTQAGLPLATLNGHTDTVMGAIQLIDGRILSWSFDKTLRLWSHDGLPITILSGHTDSVRGAVQLDNGHILSWAHDKTLRIWSQANAPQEPVDGHSDRIIGSLQLIDDHILSWAEDNTLRIWTQVGLPLATLSGHTDWIIGALQLGNGYILSWSSDKTLRLWSHDGLPITILSGHTDSVRGAVQLSDSHILSWAHDKTLRIWSQIGEPTTILEGHTDTVLGALLLTNGHILSWAKDVTLRLWLQTGEPIATLKGHGLITGALLLVDGHFLTYSTDHTLKLWSQTGEFITTLSGHTSVIREALQLANGHILSWADDHTLRLWSQNGSPLATLSGHIGTVRGAFQLANGHILSWAKDDVSLRLWSPAGEPLATLNGHTDTVMGAIQLTDGRIFSWSFDKTLRLWSQTGEMLMVYVGDAQFTYGAVIRDKQTIIIGDRQGRLLFLKMVGEI